MIQGALLPQVSPLCFSHSLEGVLLTRIEEMQHLKACVPCSGSSAASLLQRSPSHRLLLERSCAPARKRAGELRAKEAAPWENTFQSCLFPIACVETLSLAKGSTWSRSICPLLCVGSETFDLMARNNSLSKVSRCVMLYGFTHP